MYLGIFLKSPLPKTAHGLTCKDQSRCIPSSRSSIRSACEGYLDPGSTRTVKMGESCRNSSQGRVTRIPAAACAGCRFSRDAAAAAEPAPSNRRWAGTARMGHRP
eukprot:gene11846-biopygen15449